MRDTAPDMKLRLPADLRRQVEEAAKANRRTLNGEIVARLEATFAPDAGVPDFATDYRIDELGKDVEALQAEVRTLAAIVKKIGRNQ